MSAREPGVTREDARRLARAILGEDPTPDEAARWIDAVATVGTPLARSRDAALWHLARRGAPWLSWVDAGLALSDPYSPVRHRIYLMLAVLEASPTHARRFEPHESTALAAALGLGLRGAMGAARAVLGLLVVSVAGAFSR